MAAWSVPEAAKSSNAFSVTLMMCDAMNGAPSAAPCSDDLMAHSHSSTAQPSIAVLAELGEDRGEIDLPVAERTEAAGAVHPALVAAIDALPAGRIELGVLDVEHPDALVIDVDVVEIIELLQDEVARIVEQVGARVVLHPIEEHLVGDAVVQVLAGWIS